MRAKFISPFSLLVCVVLSVVSALCCSASAQSTGAAQLAVKTPGISCDSLASVALEPAVGAAVQFTASEIDTPKGKFCHVTGTIAPAIGFEVDLPVANWTQRFLQAGCGGLCGMVNASIGNAGGCQPALDGQFVVAASDLGHSGGFGPGSSSFASDPQKLIDFAYRANHLTALAAKALIHAYYGQAQRYSYFSGCSDGGREALMEAERYPGDFDGISAGAPAMNFQVQNSFYHAWTTAANLRADGSYILHAEKLPVLHQAVIAHCDTLDGNKDGLLSDPRACKVDPAWVKCPANAADTSKCFTAEEWGVAAKLYEGPVDAEGHHYLPGGLQPGSEMRWMFVPRSGSQGGGFMGGLLGSMTHVVLTDATEADGQAAHYPFTVAQYQRVIQRHGLNDATNPDLRPFASHGGKLILWHGWSDDSIAPMISIAYYRAVQKEIGVEEADRFVRLFMLPGVGHCGGGDGFSQIDTLTPLMAWVEGGHAPAEIVADKIAERRGGPGMGPGPDGRGGKAQSTPYAPGNQTPVASRPIYPFPAIARYSGSGDPSKDSSYVSSPSPAAETNVLDWYGAELLRPGFQMNYTVTDGKLTATGPATSHP